MSDHAYRRAERAIARILADPAAGDRLATLAADQGLGRWHAQRAFSRQVGLSPKRFATFVRVCRAKGLLRASASVLDAALSVGLTGPGRLHDQFLAVEAMSPGESKAGGRGLVIRIGEAASPFGRVGVAWTPRGVARLGFLDRRGDGFRALVAADWPAARLARDDAGAAALAATVFAGGGAPLHAVGSRFQIAVWRALLDIAPGAVATYRQIAERIGRPAAARAVGRAVGDNPLAVLIPCHRVIRASGLLGGYRWGLGRKAALLAGEIGRAGGRPHQG